VNNYEEKMRKRGGRIENACLTFAFEKSVCRGELRINIELINY
jgi:hypothetical protein